MQWKVYAIERVYIVCARETEKERKTIQRNCKGPLEVKRRQRERKRDESNLTFSAFDFLTPHSRADSS